MIKKKLTRIIVVAMSAVLVVGFAACGKKKAVTDNTEKESVTASTETRSIADNDLTKTGIVTFEYEDGDGNIVRLEGKAVVQTDGETLIEVTDSKGNKVTFIGKADTEGDKLTVSDIKVKDSGTLIKNDGTEVKISDGAKIDNANESTGSLENSDIKVSEDVIKEVETTKEEESKTEDITVADNNTSDTENSDNRSNAGASDTSNVDTSNDSSYVPDEPFVEPDAPDVPTEPEEPESTPEADVITTINPIDGKIYTYIEPDEMIAKYSKNNESVYELNRDVNYGGGALPYEVKKMTTRTLYYIDGTYTVLNGYYSKSGDFTATPLQMGYDPEERLDAICVGNYDNGTKIKEYGFHYLKRYIDL